MKSVKLKKIHPLNNAILFEFVNDARGRRLASKTSSGLIYVPSLDKQRDPQWGKVLRVGPDVDKSIKIGEYILIEPLMWTLGLDIEDQKVWRTDESKVMATSKEEVLEY